MNPRRNFTAMVYKLLAMTILVGFILGSNQPVQAANQIDIHGPVGSGQFGTSVTVLSNGNFVVTDPGYDNGAVVDVGAVYLFDGASGAMISMLTGTTTYDQIGWGGISDLSNGNFVVSSPIWDNGAVVNAGAVTWGSGTNGISGVVSGLNSLVGTTADDQVGAWGVAALGNGNYVVSSPSWDNGTAADAGAVTWGSGTSGVTGAVSASNSLVGGTAGDYVGGASDHLCWDCLTPLSNGNYVVISPDWHNGEVEYAGAVTWGSGTSGVSGIVSPANSLVGSLWGDSVGEDGVTALSNGNYVVISSYWNNGAVTLAGAVTWGSGTGGVSGVVSASNSLVGTTAGDQVGNEGVTPLSNGNYVVISLDWDNGALVDAGAVTWGSGSGGTTGAVSLLNSLVGSTQFDYVGGWGATPLINGNYVVRSPGWDNGAIVNAGAATWGSGTGGIAGAISPANSLVGSTSYDYVGYGGVRPLNNGNYVVSSPDWDNGSVVDAGAATWGSGSSGIAGFISPLNSLVGSTAGDQVSEEGATPLSNGNYVVKSPSWDNGAVEEAGAATWGSGTSGISGAVSSLNSLVGSTAGDQVSYDGVLPLTNGNYVVTSFLWDNGPLVDAGAATWGSGTSGISGAVSSLNSLVGSTAGDRVGYEAMQLTNGNYLEKISGWNNGSVENAGAITWGNGTSGIKGEVTVTNSLVGSTTGDLDFTYIIPLSNGDYVVSSLHWDNGPLTDAGAITWGYGLSGTIGPVTYENSVRGTTESGGEALVFDYDPVNNQLVVGRPLDNIVTLFLPDEYSKIFLPIITR